MKSDPDIVMAIANCDMVALTTVGFYSFPVLRGAFELAFRQMDGTLFSCCAETFFIVAFYRPDELSSHALDVGTTVPICHVDVGNGCAGDLLIT